MPRPRSTGFTLIEVVVALAILGWVLGSAVFLVAGYADERTRMRELGLGGQVAWNQLMERYRAAQGWQPSRTTDLETQGRERQGGLDWRWALTVEPAAGLGLFRYQVDVTGADLPADDTARPAASLTIYLPGRGGER